MTTLYSINGRRVGPEEYAEFVNDALAELQAQLDLTRKARDKWKQLYREKSSLLREAEATIERVRALVEQAEGFHDISKEHGLTILTRLVRGALDGSGDE